MSEQSGFSIFFAFRKNQLLLAYAFILPFATILGAGVIRHYGTKEHQREGPTHKSVVVLEDDRRLASLAISAGRDGDLRHLESPCFNPTAKALTSDEKIQLLSTLRTFADAWDLQNKAWTESSIVKFDELVRTNYPRISWRSGEKPPPLKCQNPDLAYGVCFSGDQPFRIEMPPDEFPELFILKSSANLIAATCLDEVRRAFSLNN